MSFAELGSPPLFDVIFEVLRFLALGPVRPYRCQRFTVYEADLSVQEGGGFCLSWFCLRWQAAFQHILGAFSRKQPGSKTALA